MTVRALGLALLGLACVACHDRSERAPAPTATLGDAAAVVAGDRISADEVRALVAATGMPPRAALERLIAERLLAQYAERRGYGAFAGVEQGVDRARVQALLARAIEQDGGAPVAEQQHELAALVAALAQRTPVAYVDAGMAMLFSPPHD